MKKFLVFIALMFAGSVHATLITNGDFSTGDTSGWTLTDGQSISVTSGYFVAYENTEWAIISQDISTVAGQLYDISFDTFASRISGNEFAWAIDGVLTLIDTTTSWTTNTGMFTASGSTTNVAFYYATDPGTGVWQLDNISVTGASAVPAPASIMLLMLGLAGIGLARKNKAV